MNHEQTLLLLKPDLLRLLCGDISFGKSSVSQHDIKTRLKASTLFPVLFQAGFTADTILFDEFIYLEREKFFACFDVGREWLEDLGASRVSPTWKDGIFGGSRSYTQDYYDRCEKMGQVMLEEMWEYLREPMFAMIFSGVNAISRMRKLVGATEPAKAKQGTIRADFPTLKLETSGMFVPDSFKRTKNSRALRNAVHASDSVEEFEREVKILCPEWAKENL